MPDRSEFLQEAKRILDEEAPKLRPYRERGDETWIVIYNTEGLAMAPTLSARPCCPSSVLSMPPSITLESCAAADTCTTGRAGMAAWYPAGGTASAIEGVPSEKSSSFRPLSDHAQACSCQDRGLLPRLWRTTGLEVARGPRTPTGPPGRRVMVERVNERSAQWKRELLYKRGLRPTLRQGPLPHCAGRGLLIRLTTDTSGGRWTSKGRRP
jgi:hypothetical protein